MIIPLEESSLTGETRDSLASLRNRGFDIGMHVRSKNQSDLWEIRAVAASPDAAEVVELRDLQDRGLSQKVSVTEFLEKFSKPAAGYGGGEGRVRRLCPKMSGKIGFCRRSSLSGAVGPNQCGCDRKAIG